MKKVNIAKAFDSFLEHWSPHIAGEVNDVFVKCAKLKGAFVWHSHELEDEMFLVNKGTLRMCFRDREEIVQAGEFIIVPRGVEHLPIAEEECEVLLIEPKQTVNTGALVNERTKKDLKHVTQRY